MGMNAAVRYCAVAVASDSKELLRCIQGGTKLHEHIVV